MLRNRNSLFLYSIVGIGLAIACGPQPIDVPEDDDDGGRSGTGATGQGGAFGGAFPTGGFPSGGTFATGGFPTGGFATGGSLPTGGTPATGGALTGGTAGTFPSGGIAGVGVTGGAAGTPATGGAAGASTTTCDATFAVGADGFVRAPGTTGCWHGYAYAGGDTGSTVTPTMFGTCGMGCMLRVTGTVGAATEANSYAGVAYLGFNVAQPLGTTTPGTVVPTGTGLQVTYTKTAGPMVIRAQITSAGGATRWCATLTTSGMTIPYTTFNTACWDNSGTAYAKQAIEAVQLVAPGDMAAAPLDMTLVSVKDI
jgi:nuclear pore complex protein Nup62